MSIISSHVSSLSSILKNPGVRSSLTTSRQKKICFRLPRDVKNVIVNYESGCDRQEYQEMICILQDSDVKDQELLDLINDLQKCISMLGPEHKNLIEVLFNINWTVRTPEITKAFKNFVEELMCRHNYHSKLVFDKLVNQFRLIDQGATEWENGVCPDEHKMKISHIHELLQKILKIIPMCSTVLMQSLTSLYPHTSQGTLVSERYLFALLQVTEYAPKLRRDILFLIVNRLMALDVSVPSSEIKYYEEDNDEDMDDDEEGAIFEMEDGPTSSDKIKEMRHPAAHMLDVCMEQLFRYLRNYCHNEDGWQTERLKTLYNDLIHIFEKIVMPTYESSHVQFVMFYFCSFKPVVLETFISWLWQKVSNPSVAPVLRQSAVLHLTSLLARANYASLDLIFESLKQMSEWVHSYISSQDSLESANSDVRVHSVFYAICQALFYLIAFRQKDLTDTRQNLTFLQNLNLNKIVSCQLNPLKPCQTAVVQKFAAVARKYQLAYCYTFIDRNNRNNLPVVQTAYAGGLYVDTFFPYDPYLLLTSGERIIPLYNYSDNGSTEQQASSSRNNSECEEYDFMDDSIMSTELSHSLEKFSYSTSPGFMM